MPAKSYLSIFKSKKNFLGNGTILLPIRKSDPAETEIYIITYHI